MSIETFRTWLIVLLGSVVALQFVRVLAFAKMRRSKFAGGPPPWVHGRGGFGPHGHCAKHGYGRRGPGGPGRPGPAEDVDAPAAD